MIQTTILTNHKGVDLHAATAVRVMQRRLAGGEALRALFRCELHTFTMVDGRPETTDLLSRGRYYNPNKHYYGHFELDPPAGDWHDAAALRGDELPEAWPGCAVASDLQPLRDDLVHTLLGGPVPAGCLAVDVLSLPLGELEPVLSGVLWRLVIAGHQAQAARYLAEQMAVTRTCQQGLLINPHQQGWLMTVRNALAQRQGDERS